MCDNTNYVKASEGQLKPTEKKVFINFLLER